MTEWGFAAASAFWLGLLTAISPCLMATNVTAVSFIARRVGHPRLIVLSSLFYIAGQALAFVLLALLVISSLLSVPLLSHWLQKYMFRLLGPILIVTALFLLELIEARPGSGRLKMWVQGRAETGGLWIAALLGIVFAMSFCPTTAALFFGSLVPLAIARGSRVLLPLCYAAGAAFPVLAFGLLIAFAARRVGSVFTRVGHAEYWARRITGGIFLAVGLYFTLAFTLGAL